MTLRTSVQSQKIRERAANKLNLRWSNAINNKSTTVSGQIVKPVNVTKNDPLVKKMVGHR